MEALRALFASRHQGFARHFASLIFIAAFSAQPMATMNVGRRPNYMRSIVTPEGQMTCEAHMTMNDSRRRNDNQK